ncbi:MAG: Na/Pi cotransporter family protein [Clostridium sp.]
MSNFEIFAGVFGGLGLFLYGMKQMGDGLEKVAGEKMKAILEKITGNRIMGALVGTIVTAIIQSSSATTVMVVSFVNAGLMSLTQATGVILGSNIGTTITAQMVSFDLEVIAPIFIGCGVIAMMSTKNKKVKEISIIAVGFGILFMGMGMMSSSMKPVAELPIFGEFIVLVGNNPFLGVLVGIVMTAILQSSSATTGILVALASVGTITIDVAFPIILGCNIGTCVTAIIAAITANRTAKKAALLHLLFKIFGTIIFLPFAAQVVDIVTNMTPDNVGRQVANAHTIFNIVITFVMLPVSGYVVKLVDKILPDVEEEKKDGAIYLDKKILDTPVLACGQVAKETLRMANKTKANFELAIDAFFNGDEDKFHTVVENEKMINRLEKEITEYLIDVSQCDLPKVNAELISETYHVINDLERIGDHAENIVELAALKHNEGIKITGDALKEIEEISTAAIKSLELAIESYESYGNGDQVVNDEIDMIEEKIDRLEKVYRENNIKRLNEKACNAKSGSIFFDLISNLERIGDHANNIATVKDNEKLGAY